MCFNNDEFQAIKIGVKYYKLKLDSNTHSRLTSSTHPAWELMSYKKVEMHLHNNEFNATKWGLQIKTNGSTQTPL